MIRHRWAWALFVAAAVSTAAAATTARTYPAGAPPYYRGETPPSAKVSWVPVSVVVGPGTPDGWVPEEQLGALARVLDARLRAHHELRALASTSTAPVAGAPDVYVGCALAGDATGDCDAQSRELVLEVRSPSKAWKSWAATALAESAADFVLVPTLRIADHWVAQKNLKGAKEVPLGTGYSQPVPWLTSLDMPVQVLQVGAVLVGRDGKVVRSGVEGIVAIRTEFGASVVGAQRTAGGSDVELARTSLRRGDLPGTPLAWEAALDNLVRQIVGPSLP